VGSGADGALQQAGTGIAEHSLLYQNEAVGLASPCLASPEHDLLLKETHWDDKQQQRTKRKIKRPSD